MKLKIQVNVACIILWKYKVSATLILTGPASKLRNWRHRKTFLSSKLPIFVNKIIRPILTLFTNCKHRHQYCIGIIRIFKQLRSFLFLSKRTWPSDMMMCAWNMIARVPHHFTHAYDYSWATSSSFVVHCF